MIPLNLRLSGFLSYRDPVEIDFTTFDLACISGHNGAGKSSLLDAMTWSLFGQARKRDDSLVNLQSEAAEVAFTFLYEGNTYRVIRTLPKGKTTMLEFQIQDDKSWRPLSERTMRGTQARIEQTLRLDYDTFVNAAFFLQGKADQFTQQTASKRKEVLGNILGLEAWEIYRDRTGERRKKLEREVENIDGRLAEIEIELAEEEQRKARLKDLETERKRLEKARKTQEAALEAMKKAVALLENQRRLTETLAAALERSKANLSGLQERLASKEDDRVAYTDLVKRASDVESAYQAWQAARSELTRLDEAAAQFREHDEKRQPFLREIETERARLEQERSSLREQAAAVDEQASAIDELDVQVASAQEALADAEKKIAERDELDEQTREARERFTALKAENVQLKSQMDELKTRIERLKVTQGASCPLCGQSLSEEHRTSTLADLEAEGKARGNQYRTNLDEMKTLTEKLDIYKARIKEYATVAKERLDTSTKVTQLSERLESARKKVADWKKQGAKRLAKVEKTLKDKKYALEIRKKLVVVDKELETLGYDTANHDAARQKELQARGAEEEYRRLESARSALRPIEDEIANLKSEIAKRELEIGMQQREYDKSLATLAANEATTPDVEAAYDELLALQEKENRVNQEVGAAKQKVNVLADLRKRKAGFNVEREDLHRLIGQHRMLERAFGKNGVPALLIEQALPQIETRANELLDRLSNGQMSIRFVTQAEYRDKKREDLKETLDIQISDGAGVRDYEMYSGGEAFRINFSIRLALSEVLAQRKGARLQTLVVDEGFGSQDTQGKQRLIEAINLVKDDFAKILVITHLDELKDAFPTRIEVEKMAQGSVVRVI